MKSESNITLMTNELHNFDGYAVRKQKNGYHFTQYVSCGKSTYPKKELGDRFKTGMKKAKKLKKELVEILNKASSWKFGVLTTRGRTEITDLGFAVKTPVGFKKQSPTDRFFSMKRSG